MTDHDDFEARLRRTFDAEAQALGNRTDSRGHADLSSATTLIEQARPAQPEGRNRALVPLLAAALLLVAGIAGVFALARNDSPVVPVASTGTRPLITATPTPSAIVAADEPFLHVVLLGDTLLAIAERYNVAVDAILRANPGLDPASLQVGSELWISARGIPGERYLPPAALPAQPDDEAPPITPMVPTPTPTVPIPAPLVTEVPLPQATPRPTPEGGLPVAASFCVTRDVGWLAEGTCDVVAIGEPANEQVAVQRTDGLGRVTAGFIAVDALAPSGTVEVPIYQPGLLEDSWCVVDIFSPDTLNVRQGPSTDRSIVGELAEGQCRIFRTVVGDAPFPGWTPVSADLADGTTLVGWVASAYLRRDVERVQSGIPMQTISVRIEPLGGGPGAGSNVPAVEAFEFVHGGVTLGTPDGAGIITIPAAVDPIGLIAQAPVEGDRFCAWTGSLEATDGAGYHVLRVAMLCA